MEKIITSDKTSEYFGKKSDKKIVLIGGCFDILHIGHIRFLKEAKSLGDILIVLLESDGNIKKIKGKDRPINSQKVRAEILEALRDVDFVILLPEIMTDKDYDDLVKKIKPDFIAVTKGDSGLPNKKRSAETVGAKVVEVIDLMADYSTNKIIKSLI